MTDLSTALAIFAAATFVPLLEMLIFRSRRRRARRDLATGEAVLEHGRGIKGFSVFAVLFFSFLALGLGGAFGSDSLSLSARLALTAALVVPFIALSCAAIAEAFGSWARFGSAGITKHSPWKGTRFLAWSEIRSIRYSPTSRDFVCRSATGKIRISNYFHGVEEFLATARERIPPERWEGPADRVLAGPWSRTR